MKILVANDDGIDALGLKLLTEFASTLGEVVVCAPKYEQSGRSHGVVFDRPFEVLEVDDFKYIGVKAYRIDAAPADCVRFALDVIDSDFDFVFAGINRGLNIGDDISYSGTCAISFEAGFAGIPAISFSSKSKSIAESANYLKPVWDYLIDKKAFEHASIFNVNIPKDPKGILLTTQGRVYYKDKFIKTEDEGMYKAEYCLARSSETVFNPTVDIDAVLMGYCSVTPLCTKRTDFTAYEKLKFLA